MNKYQIYGVDSKGEYVLTEIEADKMVCHKDSQLIWLMKGSDIIASIPANKYLVKLRQ